MRVAPNDWERWSAWTATRSRWQSARHFVVPFFFFATERTEEHEQEFRMNIRRIWTPRNIHLHFFSLSVLRALRGQRRTPAIRARTPTRMRSFPALVYSKFFDIRAPLFSIQSSETGGGHVRART